MQPATLLLFSFSLDLIGGKFVPSVDEDDMVNCHTGLRLYMRRQCDAYKTDISSTGYPSLPDYCGHVTWEEANQDNSWGSCSASTEADGFRYIISNQVPDYYFNPYCPIGRGYGYCVPQEVVCHFPNLKCGEDNGIGTTAYGDVWVPLISHFKIPLEGNPTRDDRPGDMYDPFAVNAEKDLPPAIGVAINGINIQGPNDAGDVSIDEGGFQLTCGGHVTPPTTNLDGPPPAGAPPLYHYHKSPECLEPFTNASIGVSHGGRPYSHAQLMGWALDGFGIYAYQDIDGSAPVVDECGGHFGPVDTGEVVYHYHSRPTVPYHLACQGPALGECASTQRGTNYCHPGCGAQVCVQPGTDEELLMVYLARWDAEWIYKYTVNDYKQ